MSILLPFQRSCYVLELSIVPGVARRADVFVYNRLVHIRRCLDFALVKLPEADRSRAASFAVWGQSFILWTIEDGVVVHAIDLRPFLRLHLGAESLLLSEAARRDDAWKDAVAGRADVRFELDWDGIAKTAPALYGEPLRPGETLDIRAAEEILAPFDSYLEITEDLAYGYEDLEGYGAGPPGFVDPDPPAPPPPTQAQAASRGR